jgi:hypothetical protein
MSMAGGKRPTLSPARLKRDEARRVFLILVVPIVVFGYLFVWAAQKDGEDDQALLRRLGIRRQTRLGR